MMAEASSEHVGLPEPAAALKLYRCKKCSTVTPKPTHHKMTWCECGAVGVDHGWHGSRVTWPSGRLSDWAEIVDAPAGSNIAPPTPPSSAQ